MQISKFKPYTNGIRHRTNIKKSFLSKTNHLVKQSIVGFRRFKGRSSETGRITTVPPGSILHSLSLNSKIKYVRSAGLYFQVIQKDLNICRVRLPSGLIKNTPINSFGTIGIISNFQYSSTYLGKAGQSRLLGIRPSVRGIAMNPVDHPHGGRTNGGRPSVTPWGIPTKGKPTVIRKK